ncbi:hypothetical protein B0T25DRAFT_111344 [Lasiosphaeria hispida]|uniref:Metalloprotease m41 ftsh n=1 Tax=Lasiosphaeria hispida TaxID=260671 RepID=A0AAJ0MI60_9PEZI|nr:hypothetical protein B0T25DRAFT_111344 [Lasiosphaeria hispida]
MDDELEKLRVALRQQTERANRAEAQLNLTETELNRVNAEVRATTFLEYVHNVQTIVAPNLIIETNRKKQASGAVTDVSGKVYPQALHRWTDFPAIHDKQFDAFTSALGVTQQFPSLSDVKSNKNELSPTPRKDEQDIRLFIRTYAEGPAMRIANAFANTCPSLQGTEFLFSNNAYGLHPKVVPQDEQNPPAKKRSPDRVTSLAPDRWGIRNSPDDTETTALVGEYKAAHKARGQCFRQVLGNDPLPETLFADCASCYSEAELEGQVQDQNQHLPVRNNHNMMVAKVLCQAYHYMVISGLQYGYVTSGDCMILLAIPRDTPDVLLTHLIYEPSSIQEAKQTYAAQLATLVILALGAEVPPAQWILDTERILSRWPAKKKKADGSQSITITGGALLLPPPSLHHSDDAATEDDQHDSAPSLPSRSPSPCRDNTAAKDHRRDDDPDDDGPAARPRPGIPKRKREEPAAAVAVAVAAPSGSSRKGGGMHASGRNSAPYCTQACLLGVCRLGGGRQGTFDPACPNTPVHSRNGYRTCHPVSAAEICLLVRDQLAQNLDQGCECLDKYGMFGETGVLFKITTLKYGYTFVAKGVQSVDAGVLAKEARIYSYCRGLQGTRIPVHLGNIDLVNYYPLRSIATIHHMMLMSWAGPTVDDGVVPASVDLDGEVDVAVDALFSSGIQYYDVKDKNLAWNDEVGGLMVFDFDLAWIPNPAKRTRTDDGLLMR